MKQKKEDKREKVGVLTTGLAEQGIFLSFVLCKIISSNLNLF